MQKKIRGILLFSKIHKENDLFIKFLSNNNEIISGIVYGGQSKSKKNIFQIGFFLNFNIFFKTNRPPSISAELSEPYISSILNDKYKIHCLLSVTSLVNLSIIEGQKIDNIFFITEKFIKLMISKKNWISQYCFYLMNLLKIIGYEVNYNNSSSKYFDLSSLDFTNTKSNTSVTFPYELLDQNKLLNINYHSINNFFMIFEKVFILNHLTNINLSLPNHYLLFKKQIIDYLKTNE